MFQDKTIQSLYKKAIATARKELFSNSTPTIIYILCSAIILALGAIYKEVAFVICGVMVFVIAVASLISSVYMYCKIKNGIIYKLFVFDFLVLEGYDANEIMRTFDEVNEYDN